MQQPELLLYTPESPIPIGISNNNNNLNNNLNNNNNNNIQSSQCSSVHNIYTDTTRQQPELLLYTRTRSTARGSRIPIRSSNNNNNNTSEGISTMSNQHMRNNNHPNNINNNNNNNGYTIICHTSSNSPYSASHLGRDTPSCSTGSSLGPSLNPSPLLDNNNNKEINNNNSVSDSKICIISQPYIHVPTGGVRGSTNNNNINNNWTKQRLTSWSPERQYPNPSWRGTQGQYSQSVCNNNNNNNYNKNGKKHHRGSSWNFHNRPPPCYIYNTHKRCNSDPPMTNNSKISIGHQNNIGRDGNRGVYSNNNNNKLRSAQGVGAPASREVSNVPYHAAISSPVVTPPVYCPLPRDSQSLSRSSGGILSSRPALQQQAEKPIHYSNARDFSYISLSTRPTDTIVHDTKLLHISTQQQQQERQYYMASERRTPLRYVTRDIVQTKTPLCDDNIQTRKYNDDQPKGRDMGDNTQHSLNSKWDCPSLPSPTHISSYTLGSYKNTSKEMKSNTVNNINYQSADQYSTPIAQRTPSYISVSLSDGSKEGNSPIELPSPICICPVELETHEVTDTVKEGIERGSLGILYERDQMSMDIHYNMTVGPNGEDLLDVCDPRQPIQQVKHNDKDMSSASTRCDSPLMPMYHPLDTTFNEYDDSEVVGMTAEGQLLFRALSVHHCPSPTRTTVRIDTASPTYNDVMSNSMNDTPSIIIQDRSRQLQYPKPRTRTTHNASCTGVVCNATPTIAEEKSTEEGNATHCFYRTDIETNQQQQQNEEESIQKTEAKSDIIYSCDTSPKNRLSHGIHRPPPPLPPMTSGTTNNKNPILPTTYGNANYCITSNDKSVPSDMNIAVGCTPKRPQSPLRSYCTSPVLSMPPSFSFDDVREAGKPQRTTTLTRSNCHRGMDDKVSDPQETPKQRLSNEGCYRHRNLSPSPLFDPNKYCSPPPPPPSLSSPIDHPITTNYVNLQQAVSMAVQSQGVALPPLPPIPSTIRKRANCRSLSHSLPRRKYPFDDSEEIEPLQLGADQHWGSPYYTDNGSYIYDDNSCHNHRISQFLVHVMEKANWRGRYQELLEVYENRENERPEEVQAVMEEMEFIRGCLREVERVRVDEEITSWRLYC